MNDNIQMRRATFFVVNQKSFSESVLSQYIEEFRSMELLPSINRGVGIKITSKGLEQENVLSLELKKLDDSLKVIFVPDRIDIISVQKNESCSSFEEIINRTLDVMTTKLHLEFSRLGFGSKYGVSLEDGQGNLVYGKLVNSLDETPVEWQIRKVTRTPFEYRDNAKMLVNNVCTLSRSEILVNMPASPDIINIEFDINTLPNTSCEEIKDIQSVFFKHAFSVVENSIQNYIKKIQN